MTFACQEGYFATFTFWFIASHFQEEAYLLLKTFSRARQTAADLQDETLTTFLRLERLKSFWKVKTGKTRIWFAELIKNSATYCVWYFRFLLVVWNPLPRVKPRNEWNTVKIRYCAVHYCAVFSKSCHPHQILYNAVFKVKIIFCIDKSSESFWITCNFYFFPVIWILFFHSFVFL